VQQWHHSWAARHLVCQRLQLDCLPSNEKEVQKMYCGWGPAHISSNLGRHRLRRQTVRRHRVVFLETNRPNLQSRQSVVMQLLHMTHVWHCLFLGHVLTSSWCMSAQYPDAARSCNEQRCQYAYVVSNEDAIGVILECVPFQQLLDTQTDARTKKWVQIVTIDSFVVCLLTFLVRLVESLRITKWYSEIAMSCIARGSSDMERATSVHCRIVHTKANIFSCLIAHVIIIQKGKSWLDQHVSCQNSHDCECLQFLSWMTEKGCTSQNSMMMTVSS
jgi:hypothetical protein